MAHINPYSSSGSSGIEFGDPVFGAKRSGTPRFDASSTASGYRGNQGGYGPRGAGANPRTFNNRPGHPYRPDGVGGQCNNSGFVPRGASQADNPRNSGYQNTQHQHQHYQPRFENPRYSHSQRNRFENPRYSNPQQHSPGNPRFRYNGNAGSQSQFLQNVRGNTRQPRGRFIPNGHIGRRGGRGGSKSAFDPVFSKKRSEFYCDTCDKSCEDQISFDEHKSEHMVCKLDGCTFTAQPKVILKHIQMQHSTNLFQRVKGFDSPEAVAKWRQDRKENFPTPENIAKKRSTNEEMRSRGERITGTKKKPSMSVFRYPIDHALEKLRKQEIINNRKSNAFAESAILVKNRKANKSEIVLLENYYSLVQINDKGKLVGKKLALWKPGGMPDEADEDTDTEGRKGCNGDPVDPFEITDDEVDFEVGGADLAVFDNDTDPMDVELPGGSAVDRQNDAASSTSTEKAATSSTGGLLGLVSYSSDSDSELEDGEVTEDDSLDSQAELPMEVLVETVVNEAPCLASSDSDEAEPSLERPINNPASNSDSEDADPPEEIPICKKSPVPPSCPSTSTVCERRSSFQNTSSEKVENSMNQSLKSNAKPRNKKPFSRTVKAVAERSVMERPPTLLRRLLHDEICRERNYILQTCRYIVENKFFDKSKPTEAQIEDQGQSASLHPADDS